MSQSDVPTLIQALDSRDHPVDAAYALGRIGRPAYPAVPMLIKRLEDPNRDLVAVLYALEHIGPEAKAAIPQLKRLAKNGGGRWDETRKIIRTLAGIGDVGAIMEIVSVGDFEHECGVADAIREYPLQGPGLTELLVRVFRNGLSDYVKESAAIGLARLAPQTPGLVKYLKMKLKKYVKQYAESTEETSRRFAANNIREMRTALQRIGTPDALSILKRYPAPPPDKR